MSALHDTVETAISQDGYDRMAFLEAREDVQELDALAGRSRGADALLSDVHASLFKIRPVVDEESKVHHREVLEQLMDTTEYARLRASTRMDEVASAFGTLELGAALARELPDDPDEGDSQDDQSFLPGCEGDPDAQRRHLRRIVAEAAEATEEATEAVRALVGTGAGHGAGTVDRMDLGTAVKLARQLRDNPKLKRIAKLAGRLRQVASGKRKTRYKKGPDDVVDVELGNDLARLLPSELQAMVTPELETLALLRFSQRRCLQTRRESREPVAQGPLVVAVDESGSMQSPHCATMTREVWAKAVTLALLGIARRERRDFAVVGFNSDVRTHRWGNNPHEGEILEWLARRASGGTNFAGALRSCMDLIEESGKGGKYDKADVILITDGDETLDPSFAQEWRDRVKATGAHLYVVYVQTHKDTFASFADGSARLMDLNEDGAVLDLVFGI